MCFNISTLITELILFHTSCFSLPRVAVHMQAALQPISAPVLYPQYLSSLMPACLFWVLQWAVLLKNRWSSGRVSEAGNRRTSLLAYENKIICFSFRDFVVDFPAVFKTWNFAMQGIETALITNKPQQQKFLFYLWGQFQMKMCFNAESQGGFHASKCKLLVKLN